MSSILDQIFSQHPALAADLDEVQQPNSKFYSHDTTLPMMSRIYNRWDKIGPSVIAAVREIAATVSGQQACDILHQITKVQESAAQQAGQMATNYGYRAAGKDALGTRYTHNLTRHNLYVHDAPVPSGAWRRGHETSLDWSHWTPDHSQMLKSGDSHDELQKHLRSLHTVKEGVDESEGFSLAAAKATRLAYKTGKSEDHAAAIQAHLAARGSEFPPQPPKGTWFQPNVDRWHHHDRQAKMHQAELGKGVDEVAPPGWEGTVKAMKKEKDIDNPYALAWSMKNKGMKSHKPDESEDDIDQLVRFRMENGYTVVHPFTDSRLAEGNNDGVPIGVHTSPNPELDLQELHIEIGHVLPELHGLVTSSVGPEKQALQMLFHEINTAHNEMGNILSCASQVPEAEIRNAMDHFNMVRQQIVSALSPYSRDSYALAAPPYRLHGTSITG